MPCSLPDSRPSKLRALPRCHLLCTEVRSFHGATIIGVEVVFSVENCSKFIGSHTLRTDDVHCQESVGTGPVVLKVVEFYKRVPP